jgi:hypothetical protein
VRGAGPSPVFICGLGRSGTTLLLNLLDGHPALLVLQGETRYYPTVFGAKVVARRLMRLAEFLDWPVAWLVARTLLRSLVPRGRLACGSTLRRWHDQFTDRTGYSEADFTALLERTPESACFFWTCALELGRAMDPHRQHPKRRWVEKTPETERFVAIIEAEIPGASRYLHIIRDPRAMCASRVLDPVRRATPRERILSHGCYDWSLSVALAARYTRSLNGRYHVLRYEDLVEHTEAEMRRVAAFLEIEFFDVLLEPTLFGEPTVRYSSHDGLVPACGVERGSLRRFEEALTAPDVATVEALLGNQMAALGYDVPSPMDRRHREPWARGSGPLDLLRRHAMARRQGRGLRAPGALREDVCPHDRP